MRTGQTGVRSFERGDDGAQCLPLSGGHGVPVDRLVIDIGVGAHDDDRAASDTVGRTDGEREAISLSTMVTPSPT
jgi:hypothetical protein